MEKYSSSQMLIHFSFFITTFVFLQFFFSIHTVTADEMYKSCAPFSCGNFHNITYPFWNENTQPSYCGHPKFKLQCQLGSLAMEIESQTFIIISLNQSSQLLRIGREKLYDNEHIYSCPLHYIDVTVDLDFFHYTQNDENYTLLSECLPIPNPYITRLSSDISEITTCKIEGSKIQFSYLVLTSKAAEFSVLNCKHNISVPGLKKAFTNASNTLEMGFEVRYSGVDDEGNCLDCWRSGGRCGYNTSANNAMCLSWKKSVTLSPQDGAWSWKRKFIVGNKFN